MSKKIFFGIYEVKDMTKKGKRLWKEDKRIFPYTFHNITPEFLKTKSKEGVLNTNVNNKKKLTKFVFELFGEGRYEIRIYQHRKGKFKPVPVTCVRFTLRSIDMHGDKLVVDEWDTRGKNNKFGRRFGIWKRIVDWEDEF